MPSVYAQDPTDTVDVKVGDTILYTFGSDKATNITFVNVQMGGTFTKAYFMLTADNRQYADDIIITHDDRVIRPDYTQKLADAGGTFTVKIHVPADADPDAVRHITIFGEEFVDAADCGGAANTCISNPVLQKLEINVKSADKIIQMQSRFYNPQGFDNPPNTRMHPGESRIVILSGIPDRFSHDSFISPAHTSIHPFAFADVLAKDPRFFGSSTSAVTYQPNPDGNLVLYFEVSEDAPTSGGMTLFFHERDNGGDDQVGSFARITLFMEPKPIPLNSEIPDPIHGGSIQGYGVPDQLQGTQTYTIDPELINDVKFLASMTQHGHDHVDRWNRVLAAFGVLEHDNPTTAVEAEANSKKYSSPLWPKIAEVLTILEAIPEPTQDPEPVPTVEPTPTPAIDPTLIEDVKYLASMTHHGEQHVDRWNRVLAGFGLLEHSNPMTAAEAEANSKKYSSPLWPKIAEVLTILEAIPEPTQDPEPVPTVEPTPTPAIDPTLIEDVKYLASMTHHGEQHVDRWNRVLAGFGLLEHSNPMTAAEAEANSKKYSSPLWPKIATVLKTLESN